MEELKKCPFCGREIDIENDIHGVDDWRPSYYDPDSGGDPYSIRCDCGLTFCTGTYEWDEFVEAWNNRK